MNAPPALGFLGIGEMGTPMVVNLLHAGFPVVAYDIDEERLALVAAKGARPVDSALELVECVEVVMTGLPSSESFVALAEDVLLPQARQGQVFVDLGTTAPPETRRLAMAFRRRGAMLIDAPVSGGPGGVRRHVLRMFVGGDPRAIERCRPFLEAIAGAERIVVCGGAGSGQVMKGVNQLALGLGAAAFLEAIAFGMRAGVDAATIRTAIGGGTEPWRLYFEQIAGHVAEQRGEQVGVKFRELPYFLREAAEHDFALPLTETLYTLCDAAERTVIDDHRPAPSFWTELMRREEIIDDADDPWIA